MGSGYPDGWQEAFLICQSTINSWQAQDQLSVSKYSLGQSHLKVSALVPPVSRVSCSSVWNLNPQVHKQPWSCRAFLEKISQASKTTRLLHLVRIKAEKQSAKGEVWFGLFSGVLLSSKLFSEVNFLARHYQLQWFGSDFCSRFFCPVDFWINSALALFWKLLYPY